MHYLRNIVARIPLFAERVSVEETKCFALSAPEGDASDFVYSLSIPSLFSLRQTKNLLVSLHTSI